MVGYEVMRGDRDVQNDWAPWVYALNCFFPLAISLLRDLYLAAFIGALTSAIPFVILWAADPSFVARSLAVARS
jgi:putative membrane protein